MIEPGFGHMKNTFTVNIMEVAFGVALKTDNFQLVYVLSLNLVCFRIRSVNNLIIEINFSY